MTDPTDEAYDLAVIDAGLDVTAPDDEDEETTAALRRLAHNTAFETKEQVVARYARTMGDILREKREENRLEREAQKRFLWLIVHAAGCLDQMKDGFVAAVGKPWVLYPFLFMAALMMAASVGLGDEMMDVGVSLLEHYLEVDVHGHAEIE